MESPLHRVHTLWLLALTAGCAQEAPVPSQVQLLDSAGITIAVNASDPDVPTWRVGPDPLAVLGGPADTVDLYWVTDADVLADGRIVVANAGGPHFLVFDEGGTLLRSVGREGEGPGELNWIESIWPLPGDSLLVYDDRLGRGTIFGPDGDVGHTVSFTVPPGIPISRLFRLGTGEYLGVRAGPNLSSPGDFRAGLVTADADHIQFDAEGNLLDTLATAPGDELFMLRGPSGGPAGFRVPAFGLNAATAAGPRRFYTRLDRGRRVAGYSHEGALELIIRWEGPDLALTEERVHEALVDYLGDGESADRYDLPLPASEPGFGQLLVDSGGHLWVSEYAQYLRDPRRWRVFTPEGELVAHVTVPERFRVLDIQSDRVLGRAKDALDVETVVVLALERGS